jgi:hypothetical protein
MKKWSPPSVGARVEVAVAETADAVAPPRRTPTEGHSVSDPALELIEQIYREHGGRFRRVAAAILGSAEAAEAYNASEEARTCPKCGTVNPPFPLEQWGWGVHAHNSRVVNAARRMLDAAARADQ